MFIDGVFMVLQHLATVDGLHEHLRALCGDSSLVGRLALLTAQCHAALPDCLQLAKGGWAAARLIREWAAAWPQLPWDLDAAGAAHLQAAATLLLDDTLRVLKSTPLPLVDVLTARGLSRAEVAAEQQVDRQIYTTINQLRRPHGAAAAAPARRRGGAPQRPARAAAVGLHWDAAVVWCGLLVYGS